MWSDLRVPQVRAAHLGPSREDDCMAKNAEQGARPQTAARTPKQKTQVSCAHLGHPHPSQSEQLVLGDRFSG